MADGTLRRLSPPQLSDFVFPSLSSPRSWRFQNPSILLYRPLFLRCSSSRSTTSVLFVPEKITRAARRRFGYRSDAAAANEEDYDGWRERRKRRKRKRQRLWEELLEDDNDIDDSGGGGHDDSGGVARIFEQVIDNVWILKVFKSYGYLLPFIVLSFLLTTGPKAFLTALAASTGLSLLFLAFQKLTGTDKRKRKLWTNLRSEEEDEEEEEEEKRRRVGYNPPWVRSNSETTETYRGGKRGSTEHSRHRKTSSFGGWEELDGFGPIPEPSPVTNGSARKPAGNEKKFATKRVRRERAEPLLLRLLVSVFPFLSSWTNMLR